MRLLAHEPLGWRPTTLNVRVRVYRCSGRGHVWRQGTTAAAPSRAKISRRCIHRASAGIVRQHLSIARVAQGLAVAWSTVNDAVLAAGHRILTADPARLECVKVLGVDDSGGRPHRLEHTTTLLRPRRSSGRRSQA